MTCIHVAGEHQIKHGTVFNIHEFTCIVSCAFQQFSDLTPIDLDRVSVSSFLQKAVVDRLVIPATIDLDLLWRGFNTSAW